jgi:putative endopeptidase
MRFFTAPHRLAAAAVFCVGLGLITTHASVRATDAIAEPFDVANIDRSANACTNFFNFATGNWRRAHPIPSAYTEYGYIEQLTDHTLDLLHTVLTTAQAHPGSEGSTAQKIGTLYGTCMDTAQIERRGLGPLAGELARIDALTDRSELVAEIARLHQRGVDAGFAVGPTQDFHDSTRVIAEVDQAGIGLPERDYYVRTDAESRTLRAKYRVHVARMLAFSGDAAAMRDAAAIVAFETALARGSTPAAGLREPEAVYHPMSAQRAATLFPHFAFVQYLRAADVPTGGFLNVAEPRFARTFDRAVAYTPLRVWKAYLRWHLIAAYAAVLPKRFEDENFDFNSRILNGVAAQQPRWKRCVNVTSELLGEDVGQAYVATAFSPEAKSRALDMTLRIRAAYRAEMAALAWMSPATKRIAIAKLDAMGLKVGYPSVWRRYRYAVRDDSYVANVERARVFERGYQLAKIGKPVNRGEWSMTPQTVNAYNDTQRNEIVLPAAQLQRPFFDPTADDAANIGATGAGTVGHEMTHGFDDEGHKFDLHGNLRNWWTPQDLRAFDARAGCVIKQFDNTAAVGTLHYQGHLVSGEAIADLGGLVIGYRALETSLAGKPRTLVDGFTPEQRYFIAFAQSWTESVRPEAARTEALTDPHPIPRDRVNETVRNVPGWYEAFNCPKPPTICEVW